MWTVTFKQKDTGAESVINCFMVIADNVNGIAYWNCTDNERETLALLRFDSFTMTNLAWT